MTNNKPITKKKIILIITLFLIILTSFRIGWMLYHKTTDHLYAENGVINLKEHSFTENETVNLDGEWEFYPDQLVNPEFAHTREDAPEQDFLSIPGSWDRLSNYDGEINYGTYRLKLLLPSNNNYGISIKDISSSANIYIDGKLITKVGYAAESPSQHKGKLGTYKAFFHADNNETEITIHVSNYGNAQEGGITKSIKLGTVAAINKEVNFTKTMQLLVSIILFVHSLYAFGLYFMGRGKFHRELIYFGLLLIFASLSILVDEDKLLISFLPINAAWSLKLLYLSFAGTVYFVLRFIKHVFHLNGLTFRVILTLYGVLTLFLFILPIQYIIYVGYGIMILNAFTYSFLFIQILKVIQRGNTDAIYILIANVINLFNVLWGIAINVNMIDIPYYPFDYLIAIIAFSGFLFKRHIRTSQLNDEQTKELRKADKKKDEFLANTSHELRNPLHGIINIAQVILDDVSESLTKKNRENLSLLVRIGHRMTFTLNDILDVTRLQDQRIRLHKENISLHATTAGVLDMIRFMTMDKDLQIYLKIPSSFPKVHADENRLIQILLNLIHNAVKFTDKGSVTINATHNDGIATVTISDTGMGMSEELQKNIFQPYEQGNASMRGGIGLGLFICKQLVELHEGKISFESVPDEGSVFSFTLPLANTFTNESVSKQEIAAASIQNEKKKELLDVDSAPISDKNVSTISKILVVDDDPVNLRVLKMMLARDYEISTATSGDEALKLIDTGEWDLIISDVMMLNMSGYELTQIIREQFKISELPILLLTARSQLEDIYTGFHAGANDYITKPIDALELKARVKVLTDLKQSFREQLQMEAAWLQAQIQPHFLFNTLNTIASLGEIDTARMVKLLDEFGNYLRKSFSAHNTQSLISLEDELDLTRSYLFIEKERFGERIQIEWEILDELDLQIPPLSIQTIVENAVRHGILKRINGGTIHIRITDQANYYEIAIVDDGVGMDQENVDSILSEHPSNAESVGIANTNRRLKQLYGQGLKIKSMANHGTTVSFQIPK